MKLIKNIIVAFSLYSQIPMPRFEWKEEDMKHNLIFLPWVGGVIGLLSFGLYRLFLVVELPLLCKVALYSLVPLLVTGGFHVDGYMDVQDALKSYKTPEEKLEILKDPHIGAFAIIRLLIYALAWGAALSIIVENADNKLAYAYFASFFIARAVSAASSLKCKHARKNGMLHMETSKSSNIDFAMEIVQIAIGFLVLAYLYIPLALAMALTCIIHMLYYKQLCYKQFGGITGDTVGYSITTLEEWLLIVIAVMTFWVG